MPNIKSRKRLVLGSPCLGVNLLTPIATYLMPKKGFAALDNYGVL
jgi:hypothetical protein